MYLLKTTHQGRDLKVQRCVKPRLKLDFVEIFGPKCLSWRSKKRIERSAFNWCFRHAFNRLYQKSKRIHVSELHFRFQAILRHVYDIRVYSCCLSFLYHAWVAITPAFFKPVDTRTIVLRFQKAPLREGKSMSVIVPAWKYDESTKNPVHLQATNAFLWTGLGIYFMKRGKGGLVDVYLTEIPVKNLNENTAVSSRYSLLKEREETDVFADYLWESYRF